MIMRILLIALAFAASASASAMHGIRRPIQVGANRALMSLVERRATTFTPVNKKDLVAVKTDLRGGAEVCKPPALLKWAYVACGLATTAAWTTIVLTTIRSNQPLGMMMPTFQHGFFARIGALSAAPLIAASFTTLAYASNDSWEQLSSPTCRRQNLALVVAGVGSALWVGFAPLLTKIPGTEPLVSHQVYSGVIRAALIGAYGSAATLSAAVWARSLPADVRKNPLSWPGRVADGVTKSLVSLAPVSRDDPVNVKYALLASGFLFFTGLQLGSHPTSVIPSWTGRRLARHFPVWTLLAAVTSYDLKEAAESGKLLTESSYRALSNGLKGFGTLYLGAKVGAVFLDPSFPQSYHAVQMVPGWATAAIVFVGLTLRTDKPSRSNVSTMASTLEDGFDDDAIDDSLDDGLGDDTSDNEQL